MPRAANFNGTRVPADSSSCAIIKKPRTARTRQRERELDVRSRQSGEGARPFSSAGLSGRAGNARARGALLSEWEKQPRAPALTTSSPLNAPPRGAHAFVGTR